MSGLWAYVKSRLKAKFVHCLKTYQYYSYCNFPYLILFKYIHQTIQQQQIAEDSEKFVTNFVAA